jgi:hypothetical protein
VSREPTRTLREASGIPLTGSTFSAFTVARDAIAVRLGIARTTPVVTPSVGDAPLPARTVPITSAPTSVGTAK